MSTLRNYWGEGTDREKTQVPTPTLSIPIMLGGTGPRMLKLVREHADWWNLPATKVDKLREYSPSIGSARVSVQQMVGFVRDGADRDAIVDKSQRRLGHLGPGLVCGTAGELIEYFAGLEKQGAQRFYVWFADFAPVDSIEQFGKSVIAACSC